ncbi:hypothetical protein T459_27232 [Capsicum annuum]|uniref:Uncharacterized protein n=1 Tax=Capsicum annuum TaxID=4072 RepID=A0A2G2YDC9_CAPAN|nr:hypothetical protein T459_27232 [Capsicum annuum]
MCSLSSSLHLNLLQELVTQVIEATPNGEPSNPNDAQLDLSYEMPRFYIMQIKCFRQNLPPSFVKSLTCSFCDKPGHLPSSQPDPSDFLA